MLTPDGDKICQYLNKAAWEKYIYLCKKGSND